MGVTNDANFLRIRGILKERIRRDRRNDSSDDNCPVQKKKIPKHRSFFGPSQHCIAQRLIDGKDALMQELKISSEDVRNVEIPDTTSSPESSDSESDSGKLSKSRDYSFLSIDEDEEEAPKEGGKDIRVSKSSYDEEQSPDSIKEASKSDQLAKKSTKRRLIKSAAKVDDEDEDEEEVYDISSEIQKLMRGNSKTPSVLVYDDRDDHNMVSSRAEIEREERISARKGREEDEIEAQRIEKEEKEERLRKAKKRKLLHNKSYN